MMCGRAGVPVTITSTDLISAQTWASASLRRSTWVCALAILSTLRWILCRMNKAKSGTLCARLSHIPAPKLTNLSVSRGRYHMMIFSLGFFLILGVIMMVRAHTLPLLAD